MKNLAFHTTVIYPESLPQLPADMNSTQVNDSLRVIRLRTPNLVVRQTFLDLPGELQNATAEENFARLLTGGDYPIVHFQDLSAWGTLALPLIAKQLGKRVVISLPDYFLLCPDKNLVLPNGKPCGKPIADGQDQQCLQCLAAKTEILVHDVLPLDQFLQKRHELVRQILQQADVLIAASTSIRQGFLRAVGKLAENIQVMKSSEVYPQQIDKLADKIQMTKTSEVLKSSEVYPQQIDKLADKIQVTKTSEVLKTSEVYSLYNKLLGEEEPETPTLQEQTAPFIQRLLGNDTQSAGAFHLGDNVYQQWLEKQSAYSLSPQPSPSRKRDTLYGIHLLIHLQRYQEKYLKTTLAALRSQVYNHWYLSIVADFTPTDNTIWNNEQLCWILLDSDSQAIGAVNCEMAAIQADWVALIEAGDSFEPQLLSYCIRYIDNHPGWQLIYVDEDSISTRHERYEPKFKPDFNLELLRAMPYLGSFCLVRREAQQAVGGYAPYSGMANYDIALKVLDHYGEAAIEHIAQMLYHRLDMNELPPKGSTLEWGYGIDT